MNPERVENTKELFNEAPNNMHGNRVIHTLCEKPEELALDGAFVVLLLGTAIFSLSCHLPVRISTYRGDGQISGIRFAPNPGVKIDFEKFPLTAPYEATLSLDGLPRHHSVYKVGIVLDLPSSELGRRPTIVNTGPVGTVSMQLLDGTGQIIFDCRSTLDKMYWKWTRGEVIGVIHDPRAQRSATSTFLSESYGVEQHVPTVLHVSYTPESNAPDVWAMVRITAGATK